MKKIMIKPAFFFALVAGLLTSCVQEDDTSIPEVRPAFFSENFPNSSSDVLNLPGWTNIASTGTVKWSVKTFSGNGYAQFNSFGVADATSIAWLITPEIDLENHPGAKFTFRSAQNFVSNAANKLEVLVSTDFDGTNFATATWTKVNPVVADLTTKGYEFIKSGPVDLTPFEAAGKCHIAFRATGSGSNTALDGLFQVDKLYVYTN